jgi:glycosyltransferase involved in cell wall biosynthesis
MSFGTPAWETSGEMNRPSIHYVVAQPSWPLENGQRLRQYHILRALAHVADVRIVCLGRIQRAIPIEIQCLSCGVEWAERPKQQSKGLFERVTGILSELWGAPTDLSRHPLAIDTNAMFGIDADEFEVVWFERIDVAYLALGLRGRANILDLDDIEHRKLVRDPSLSEKKWLHRVRRMIKVRAWRRVEFACLQTFDSVAVCSENDREYLGSSNVVVISNGASIQSAADTVAEVDGRILFVGFLAYEPNDDALCYFIQDILPLILQEIPHAHLQVVGRSPSLRLQSLAKRTGVALLGYVDEVGEVLRTAAISIAPIRIGGGTRLKILESLGAGKATVSTTIGAEGLGFSDGVELLLADDPKDFAAACCRLINDPGLRTDLGIIGQQEVAKRFSWEKVEKDVQILVQNAIAGRQNR